MLDKTSLPYSPSSPSFPSSSVRWDVFLFGSPLWRYQDSCHLSIDGDNLVSNGIEN
ncbi:MAG: hypothetical protein F6K31_17950 [Symploca sp. SIO2G7]|nr:hypothetical protein [Symploca sp. SIO2G7]